MRTPRLTDWESPESGPATVRVGLDDNVDDPGHGRCVRERDRTSRDTVFHAAHSQWDQEELGSAFDIGPLSVIGELDPTGVNGVLEDRLEKFGNSLEPSLSLLEQHRARGDSSGIKFEASRLTGSASELGAMQLSAACIGITMHFDSDEFHTAPGKLDDLVDLLMIELVRVQRKVRQLLGHASAAATGIAGRMPMP